MRSFLGDVFVPKLEEMNIKTVVHLGDLFDRRKYVNIVTADAAMSSLIEPVLSRGVDLHVMVGNHDCYYRNTNRVNSVRALYGEAINRDDRRRGKMSLYEEPTEIDLGVKTLVVPWIPTDDAPEHLARVKRSSAPLCLGHLEIAGFDMYRGSTCEHGVERVTFDHFDTVLSGHFHTRSRKTNVHYVGAAGQYTWADHDDPRGFAVLDTDDLSVTYFDNPYECFAKVHYDGSDEAADSVREAALDRRFVKLIVAAGADVKKLAGVVDTVESRGVFDLQVVDDHGHRDAVSVEEISHSASDTLDIMRAMIEKNVDWRVKDEATALAVELYTEAVAMTGDK